ncbi:MAG: TRAP transporter substrate-binding protein [Elusimicrobiota bacterium]|jgi:tripartite ATP-independent transporter DctP family solute receptor|nr:TRAP transporter substrate-binding protein [Elusimicrobiota bacterium]
MKKIVLFGLAVVLALTLVSCGGKKDKKVIKIGIVVPATQSVAVALEQKFKPMIEEKIPGAEVQLFTDGVLGGEKELFDSVRDGKLDIIVIGSSFWSEIPQILITDFPFLYRDVDHAQKVYNGEVGQEIAKLLLDKTGIRLLAWGPNGARVFSSGKQLTKLADFKGQKIRMPNNPLHVQMAKALGANVIIMPMGEIFTSLEQKVIDGQDNPMRTLVSYGWYEVQKYVYLTNHMVASLEILGSPQFWDSLTPEQQTIVNEAAQATSDYAWEIYKASIAEDELFLKDHNLVVTAPTLAEQNQMQALVGPIYNNYIYKEYPWAKELVQKARAVK